MPNYRQRKLSVTPAQVDIIQATHGQLSCQELSKLPEFAGISAGKIQSNKVLLGLSEPLKKKVINFETNGFFDIKKWGKVYNW